ncbi:MULTISPECIES: alanine--tRNA ligase [Halomonadaceae]|jgi:alanyl-tRNA synthetase|uniref:alanine--tRNA ligase n=1 Tax=Halomonadaceae TaxID=28256 RepID=UPI0012F3EFE5|nr:MULTISPECIES: alanine--tRNA ligase [Halomonas]CAD5268388.1 alanyl-tRNA synthetase [Halomonas sp. I3]CAD5274301.1 alanyl-tRNA synthetase [Halomonas sp. 113]CAD5275939.1 alanyl-tRNA synthetase [Halomonas sp. 59]CAD5277695.1 alanyl-tRNA synthetase [Halomonas sp. 156]VXB95347.1 alanyl-tRNA synthetase [Halomonas titanicae]
MKSAEIRQAFLTFFEEQGHTIVPTSSLVPGNDPTLLFTNAGMVPFKDVFLGRDPRPYVRATSAQRCVRAGGKHNDLDNVGYTARHHTFFEMLGNFSFGDYFKRDAIRFAWVFLTETLGLPKDKLWVTVHISDDEAERIWKDEIGIDPERFSKLDEDNFWQMGDTGPCGPSSEIFFDHGPEVWGGPPGSPEEDGDRYIEIWNLVFMQFDRDAQGTLNPLPKPSIDTGMGLERVAAVMQGVHSNYEIDLFQNLLQAAAKATGHPDTATPSLRVIADHIRSCAFLIADGVLPSNEGRGYVLRRIIRRAIRHGHKLGAVEPFFHKLVEALDAEMGDAYPELREASDQIARVLLKEEEQFARTLDHGMGLLNAALAELDGKVLPGETVFKLYDTYGFPFDLTADVCRERGVSLDEDGFQQALEAQRERARAASQFGADYSASIELEGETAFTGYDRLEDQAKVTALVDSEGNPLAALEAGQKGVVVLDRTPFYGESGGQVGDTGYLYVDGGRFQVTDTQKQSGHHLHQGMMVEGSLSVGASVRGEVDASLRTATIRNHSATHLLHKALRMVLGDHVQQKGSLVNAERLRFDFSHFEPVTAEQLAEVERLVNEQILANAPTKIEQMSLDQAKAKGAAALFEAKYAENVRVLTIGADDFSIELCGGTHVARSGDIGCCHVMSEVGIASGVRRIEAITGENALAHFREQEARLERLGERLKTKPEQVEARVESLVERNRSLEKELEQLKAKLASAAGSDMLSQVQEVNGVKLLATQLDGVSGKDLRGILDQLKNKLSSGVIILGVADQAAGKVSLIAGVTQDLTGRVKAGELVNHVASQVGGKGGGRPDMAQAGGSQPDALPDALKSVPAWLENVLS